MSYSRVMELYNAEQMDDDARVCSGACFTGDGYVDYCPATYDDPAEGGYFESWRFEGFDGETGLEEFVGTYYEALIEAGAIIPDPGEGDLVLPKNVAALAVEWCSEELDDGGAL